MKYFKKIARKLRGPIEGAVGHQIARLTKRAKARVLVQIYKTGLQNQRQIRINVVCQNNVARIPYLSLVFCFYCLPVVMHSAVSVPFATQLSKFLSRQQDAASINQICRIICLAPARPLLPASLCHKHTSTIHPQCHSNIIK